MRYRAWLAGAVSAAASTGLVLAVALSIALVVLGGARFDLNLSLELSRFDGLWFLVLLPGLLVLLVVIASPLAYLLHRLGARQPR